jgi:predicted metal-dependent hydrolase
VPNEPFATHVLDVLHLLLPAGEEFFVEVFKKTLPLIKDDQLRLDVQGFIGQEAVHSQAHSGVLDHFAAQGVDVTPYTDQIGWLFEKLLGERPRWSLRRQHSWLLEQVSFVSAIEHYTAILGEWILNAPAHDAVGTDRTMLDMLRWHGAEEVEHKAVAFDTMKHLRAGYWRQVRAQLVVTPAMLWLWIRGVRFMYSVDPQLPPGTKPRWRDYFRAARRGLVPGPMRFIRVVGDYYRPGFHPSQLGGLGLAVDYLAVSPAARASH